MEDISFDKYFSNVRIDLLDDYARHGVSLSILREDLIHPEVSGNKLRKLKYNIVEVKKGGFQGLITFGGAFSNHIAATAAAGNLFGVRTVGVIRGEELHAGSNPTLTAAVKNGMELTFISRERYRKKDEIQFLEGLQRQYPGFMVVPEGGSNELGVKGCEEILGEHTKNFDVIAVACGTGTTLAGIIRAAETHQKVLGFSVIGGEFPRASVEKYIHTRVQKNTDWEILSSWNFGGYARVTGPLIDFIRTFHLKHSNLAEPIYTGKMFFGLDHLINRGFFKPGTKILAIHTGGLQGWHGFRQLQPSGTVN